jgi:hypothetical protein
MDNPDTQASMDTRHWTNTTQLVQKTNIIKVAFKVFKNRNKT